MSHTRPLVRTYHRPCLLFQLTATSSASDPSSLHLETDKRAARGWSNGLRLWLVISVRIYAFSPRWSSCHVAAGPGIEAERMRFALSGRSDLVVRVSAICAMLTTEGGRGACT